MWKATLFGALMLATGGVLFDRAAAQTALREDVFDIQTALHYYGFIPGPVDGKIGPATERGFRDLTRYLKLGTFPTSAMEAETLPTPLRALLDAYSDRNRVSTRSLDERDLGRLTREGERFWIRKELQTPERDWGVLTPREEDQCGAWANEGLIGTVIDPDKFTAPEGAETVRVIYYSPITMDLRPTRLNVDIDPWNVVTNLSCN